MKWALVTLIFSIIALSLYRLKSQADTADYLEMTDERRVLLNAYERMELQANRGWTHKELS